MTIRLRAIGLVALGLLAFAVRAEPVQVTGGKVEGAPVGAMTRYLGIPFAAPPVGELRWRAPQPVVPWSGVKQASSFAPACAQTAAWITLPKSEDCLYLNVWTPAPSTGKLPVIVWIHGGGYYGGTAAQPLYDGANLARRGAVVVTVNYRLGIWGFFSHPELTAESPDHVSGNQGIQDQIAALRWVKQNIAAFGGDPGRVTIMGESAGAISVAILTVSPLAQGLFQRAIAESGSDIFDSQPERGVAETKGAAFAKTAGAGSLAELRGMSVEALQQHSWTPRAIVDGHVLREDLPSAYRNQHQNDVPLLAGWNAEEGRDLAPEILGTSDFTAAKRRAQIGELLGHAPSDALLAAYPAATDAQAKAAINRFTTDWWGWRTANWAGLQARYGRAKSYMYFFAHLPAEPATPCGYGCGPGHGAEVRYVFDNLDQDPRRWATADREVADRLAATWVNFASTGNPNGKGLPAWPAFDGTRATVLKIGDEAQLKAYPLPDFGLFQ